MVLYKKIYGEYLISSVGKVFSIKTKKLRSQIINKNGYAQVSLRYNGKTHTKYIHRLVAEAFIPNEDNKPEIDHINTIKTDNRVENLRWVNRRENNENILTKKHMSTAKKGKHYSKRTEFPQKTVYQYTLDGELVKKWESSCDASRNGFSQSKISLCCNGKRNWHKGFIWSFRPL